MNVCIYTDGACRGNPGPASIGVVIKDDNDQEILEIGQYIGNATNNIAEYKAVIIALENAKKVEARNIKLFVDSELLVKQIKGLYKVKNPVLQELHGKILLQLSTFDSFQIFHIDRSNNKDADALANLALDKVIK